MNQQINVCSKKTTEMIGTRANNPQKVGISTRKAKLQLWDNFAFFKNGCLKSNSDQIMETGLRVLSREKLCFGKMWV